MSNRKFTIQYDHGSSPGNKDRFYRTIDNRICSISGRYKADILDRAGLHQALQKMYASSVSYRNIRIREVTNVQS